MFTSNQIGRFTILFGLRDLCLSKRMNYEDFKNQLIELLGSEEAEYEDIVDEEMLRSAHDEGNLILRGKFRNDYLKKIISRFCGFDDLPHLIAKRV
jgi:hypothetical protein